jgi:hypothetical protein
LANVVFSEEPVRRRPSVRICRGFRDWSGPALPFQPGAMRLGFGDRAGLEWEALRVGHHAIVRELHLDAVLVVEQELRINPLAAFDERPEPLTRPRCADRPRVAIGPGAYQGFSSSSWAMPRILPRVVTGQVSASEGEHLHTIESCDID